MKRDTFTIAFLGIFLFVLIIFFAIFFVVSSQDLTDGTQTALWAALTILLLLFGVIGISLYLNRDKK